MRPHGAPLVPRYPGTGLRRLLRNLATALYRPPSGAAPPPVLAVLNPTADCNLRCRFCFERADSAAAAVFGRPPECGELAGEEYGRLIDTLAHYRPTFYVTGGEPLLSAKTLPILQRIKARGLYVSLNTNGVLLAERARDLVQAGVDKVIVSIDGPRRVHNRLRGDSFEAMAHGIETLRRAKRAAGSPLPYIRAQCMLSPYNIGAMTDTADTVRALGLRELRFQHLMFAPSRTALDIDAAARELAVRLDVALPVVDPAAIDVEELRRQMARLARGRADGLVIRYEPDLPAARIADYYRARPPPFGNDCLSAWRRLNVSAYGELGPCQGVYLARYPETSVAAAWNGEPFRRFRRQVLRRGLFAHCLRCCHREYGRPRGGLEVH